MKKIHSAEQEKLRELLREMRVGANLTQAGLAARLNVPQSFVSKYEAGERRLDVLELRQVCAALKVSFVDFARRLEKALE